MKRRLFARCAIYIAVACLVAAVLSIGVYIFFQPQSVSVIVRDWFRMNDKPEKVATRLYKAIQEGNLQDFQECYSIDAIHRYQVQMDLIHHDKRPPESLLKDYMAYRRNECKDCIFELKQTTYSHDYSHGGETAVVTVNIMKRGDLVAVWNLNFVQEAETLRWVCVNDLLECGQYFTRP